jgi:ribosomal protein S18 acetylase RimI-like enzyme
MVNIEYIDNLDDELYKILDNEFNKYAIKKEITCNYATFNFIAKENGKIVGIITGHSYYKEVYIEDLIIFEQYRNMHIGSRLINSVEEHFKNKGFENINLTTYNFQAPEFYKKCGFKLEFIRENKDNPKLNKYFFVKYF